MGFVPPPRILNGTKMKLVFIDDLNHSFYVGTRKIVIYAWSWVKPDESQVEARKGTDVQIVLQNWV